MTCGLGVSDQLPPSRLPLAGLPETVISASFSRSWVMLAVLSTLTVMLAEKLALHMAVYRLHKTE